MKETTVVCSTAKSMKGVIKPSYAFQVKIQSYPTCAWVTFSLVYSSCVHFLRAKISCVHFWTHNIVVKIDRANNRHAKIKRRENFPIYLSLHTWSILCMFVPRLVLYVICIIHKDSVIMRFASINFNQFN